MKGKNARRFARIGVDLVAITHRNWWRNSFLFHFVNWPLHRFPSKGRHQIVKSTSWGWYRCDGMGYAGCVSAGFQQSSRFADCKRFLVNLEWGGSAAQSCMTHHHQSRSLLLYITSQMQWNHMFMLNSASPLQWQTKCENWINRWLYSIVLLSAI